MFATLNVLEEEADKISRLIKVKTNLLNLPVNIIPQKEIQEIKNNFLNFTTKFSTEYKKFGEEKEQNYVMDLFWDDEKKLWKDNRRLDVYNMYYVFGYNDETGRQDKKMYRDNLCVRNDVIAFKKLPNVYRKRRA